MPATLKEVQDLVKKEFKNADTKGLFEDKDNHRIFGYIISEEFKEEEYKDISRRNQVVTQRVRKKLGANGINVGFLIPLAPGEEDFHV